MATIGKELFCVECPFASSTETPEAVADLDEDEDKDELGISLDPFWARRLEARFLLPDLRGEGISLS